MNALTPHVSPTSPFEPLEGRCLFAVAAVAALVPSPTIATQPSATVNVPAVSATTLPAVPSFAAQLTPGPTTIPAQIAAVSTPQFAAPTMPAFFTFTNNSIGTDASIGSGVDITQPSGLTPGFDVTAGGGAGTGLDATAGQSGTNVAESVATTNTVSGTLLNTSTTNNTFSGSMNVMNSTFATTTSPAFFFANDSATALPFLFANG